MNKELLAYAVDFSSFLIDRLSVKELENVKEIILFGSVSRGEAGKESDVDMFVNVIKRNGIDRAVDKIANDFYGTEIFKRWKLRGIENEIKVIADRMDAWKDLKISLISDGITLYSKYLGHAKGKQQVIIYWGKVEPDSKRVLLSKKLYGYSYKTSRYKGIVELTSSTKLAANCIIADLEDAKKITDLMRELGITVHTIHVSRIDVKG